MQPMNFESLFPPYETAQPEFSQSINPAFFRGLNSQPTKVNIRSNSREDQPRGDDAFPCTAYLSNLKKYVTREIPFHWHDEVQLVFAYKDSLCVRLDGGEIKLLQGEGVFLNSHVLHAIRADGGSDSYMLSIAFSSSLISGARQSVFEQKYMEPLLLCDALPFIKFSPSVGWEKDVLECILQACTACAGQPYGFEFLVRENLSKIFYSLTKNFHSVIAAGNREKYAEKTRIKKMLDFLYENYSQKISLPQIAAAANISERECFRCFERVLSASPILYLQKYRISVAISLLQDTDMPVTEICYATGFNSPSYFCMIFKRYMHCTPSVYRKNSALQQEPENPSSLIDQDQSDDTEHGPQNFIDPEALFKKQDSDRNEHHR